MIMMRRTCYFRLTVPEIPRCVSRLFQSYKSFNLNHESIVSKVLGAVEDYANKDERMQAFLAEQINKARSHDIATFDKTDKFSNRLRSSVRPLTTFAAMAWYIYARLNEIPLQAEDYAIIGGIMAFWFGFRPFEKRQ